MTAISIRRAVIADRFAIHAVHTASIRGLCAAHYSPEDIERWAGFLSPEHYVGVIEDPNREFVVAEAGGEIAGFGQAQLRQGEIEAVYVDPKAARKGVGRRILGYFEDLALGSGLASLQITATLNAVPFYESRGFQMTGHGEHLHPSGAMLRCASMTKVLRTDNPSASGKVLSVSVGGPREFEYEGRAVRSAIWKTPVVGRIAARGVNLAGDDQADRAAHGGPDKAVYAYASEDYRWWERELGRTLAFAEFGENLTTEGVDVNAALIGERWRIGTVLLEVSEPRIPCWRLGVRMNDPKFVGRFTAAMRPGAYLRILAEGDVGAGDEIRIDRKPDTDLTVHDVFRIFTRDRGEAQRLLGGAPMSAAWKRWARDLLQKSGHVPAEATPSPTCC